MCIIAIWNRYQIVIVLYFVSHLITSFTVNYNILKNDFTVYQDAIVYLTGIVCWTLNLFLFYYFIGNIVINIP